MLVEVQTRDGPRKVRVCDYCKSACIPSGRFCSSYCARAYNEFQKRKLKAASEEIGAMTRLSAQDEAILVELFRRRWRENNNCMEPNQLPPLVDELRCGVSGLRARDAWDAMANAAKLYLEERGLG